MESLIKRIVGLKDKDSDNVIARVGNELAAIENDEGLFENVVRWAGYLNTPLKDDKSPTNN